MKFGRRGRRAAFTRVTSSIPLLRPARSRGNRSSRGGERTSPSWRGRMSAVALTGARRRWGTPEFRQFDRAKSKFGTCRQKQGGFARRSRSLVDCCRDHARTRASTAATLVDASTRQHLRSFPGGFHGTKDVRDRPDPRSTSTATSPVKEGLYSRPPDAVQRVMSPSACSSAEEALLAVRGVNSINSVYIRVPGRPAQPDRRRLGEIALHCLQLGFDRPAIELIRR